MDTSTLSNQEDHWEDSFKSNSNMFGNTNSTSAQRAVEIFKKGNKFNILELGSGQGRDTLFFAKEGLRVQALDYSQKGIDSILKKSKEENLSNYIKADVHDIREPLPFKDNTFDSCYSHMLYCMALTTSELEFLSSEIRRVLKPNGLNIYTVRNIKDPHYKNGIHRGEDMYEVAGFIVHFFSKEKIELLSKGYKITDIEEFEESTLPKRLSRVIMEKIS
jgi:ubiquinone/menaquinone biosynthesis C-methylase UbiE